MLKYTAVFFIRSKGGNVGDGDPDEHLYFAK